MGLVGNDVEYLRNAWYAAAAEAEVTRTPLRRVLLETPVVLFRGLDGGPVALQDRCAHRFAPLSRGTLHGDELQCGYHGLRYDRTGRCVHNPHGPQIPAHAGIRAYPLVARYGFIWLWAGDPARADATLLPDLSPFDPRPGYRTQWGYLRIDAHYQLIIDNLLDLSHVEYLHPAFATGGAIGNTRHEVLEADGVVHANRWKPGCTVSPLLGRCWGRPGATGDMRSCIRWHPPGTLFLDVGATEAGADPRDGVTLSFLHLPTPENGTRTHYFWAATRRHSPDDDELTDWIQATTERAFMLEDEPMIEAQQDNLGPGADMASLHPVYLAPDLAPVKARRILARLIEAERNAQPPGIR